MGETIFDTTIVLDEEKIEKSEYSHEKVNRLLDKLFNNVGMVREGNTFKGGTFANVGGVMVALFETAWFMPFVKEWSLIEKDGDTVLSVENVLESKALKNKYLNKYGL